MKRVFYVLFALLSIILLSGCIISKNSSVKYEDADKYIAGDNTIEVEQISSLNLNWISGKVKIIYNTELTNSAKITETYNMEEVEDKLKVHSYYENGVLNIQPCESGQVNFGTLKKELVIEIGNDITINKIDIDNVSGDVSIKVQFNDLFIDSVSANYDIEANDINKIDVDSVSGNFNIKLNTFESMEIDNTSGIFNVKVTGDMVVKVELDTVSGKVTNQLESNDSSAKLIDFDTVSGDLNITTVVEKEN